MEPKKNIFSYFVIGIYLISVLYLISSGISTLGTGQEYPYLLQGILLVALLLIWLMINGIAGISIRLDIEKRLAGKEKWLKLIEFVLVFLVMTAALILRIKYIQAMPMKPESDFKTYYEIADLLKKGTLIKDGPGYCDYIAMFPHVYGYPYLLSIVFGIFGTSVQTAQYFNIVLAVLTVFLVYRTGRIAGGRGCGLVCLVLAAFWPSQIVYINMVASEYLFSFLLILSLYMFIKTLKEYSGDTRYPVRGVLLHILLGAVLAVTSAVRPMALILLITIIICIFTQKMKIPARLPKDQPLTLRILEKGWFRCLIVAVVYFSISSFISLGISYTVDEELASGSASFGYNLLVGLNEESYGGWNQEDADYLYDSFDQTGSATEAHLACRDLAVMRLQRSPEGMLNLFVHKFQILWSNDDYGSTWNILFMDQQGTLTKARETFLYEIRDINNIVYLIVVAFAGIGGIFLWRRGNGINYPFVLVFVGTLGMHLFVENQNRYHYHVLFMFILMAGYTVKEIYEMNRQKIMMTKSEDQYKRSDQIENQKKIEELRKEEEELIKLRQEAMQIKFDMKSALEKGLITVSVSEAYKENIADEPVDESKEIIDEEKMEKDRKDLHSGDNYLQHRGHMRDDLLDKESQEQNRKHDRKHNKK
jgi:hypothetical protein